MSNPEDAKRPDPDALLERVRAEEARSKRGSLQVYLGMCPGVGKTYAMLEAAQEDRRSGKQVLVGVVETHGRAETGALLDGLPILPRRHVSHRGVALAEFDIDAALASRAKVVLVDELAHTNAPGSRHQKRWQDVQELLQAGIDVKTTLNIQHIESLNDVLARITGIRVRETVPDSVLDAADEVVLVDLPPEDLRERLEGGKVYLGEQAARAADGFFKPATLTALRELALRYVAGRVGRQVRFYREASGSPAIWPTQERVLVAVGPAPTSATLVRSAKRLASMLGCDWFALYVETARPLSPADRERVTAHLRLAESLGARTASITSSGVSEGLLQFARRENVTKVVVGKPLTSGWRERLRPSPVDRLIRDSDDIDVHVIRGEQEGAPLRAGMVPSDAIAGWRWWWAPPTAAGAAAALGKLLSPHVELADVAMIFLFASGCVAFLGSRRAALVMAALSVLCFNFFFVPPMYTFRVAGSHYLITFGVLLTASLLLSELTLRLRQEKDLARVNEERTAKLYRMSKLLAERRGIGDAPDRAAEELARAMEDRVIVTVRSSDGRLSPHGGTLDPKEAAVVDWVIANGQAAGRGTATLTSASMTHYPMPGQQGVLGAVSIAKPLPPREAELLLALARHVGLVLSIESLQDERRRTMQEMETERLRSSILASVSHDLRTPLASILGSASTLQEQDDGLPPQVRRELVATITEEADRLNRLIANLLEMTRIEGGALRLSLVPLPVEEIIGASLHATRRVLSDRRVTTSVADNLPFVVADELLIQQVLVNLLDNAAKHTPRDAEITLSAALAGPDRVMIAVSDRGTGLPPGDPSLLFERFHRGDTTGTGAGLGLAICKGIVQAHGGIIEARNRDGGGAEFRFTLPATDQRPQDGTGEEEAEP